MPYGRASCFFAAFCTLLFCCPVPWACSGVDRCLKYYPQVVREARFHIGMDAPAHDFMGQIETESACNAGVTAFDGGMGLGQFMPATAEWIQEREEALKDLSVEPLPYDPRWAIRALILYDHWLFKNVTCPEWHFAFRAYNGGLGNLNREIGRAGTCDPEKVAACCKRKVLRLKKGFLDLCRVNVEYPEKILRAAEKYRRRFDPNAQ